MSASISALSAPQADVVVVGGGLAGLTLTALMAGRGITSLCLDRESAAGTNDTRTVAISFGSKKILMNAGVWQKLKDADLCPIRDIHITDSGSPLLLQFLARETGEDAFGWIVENKILRRALMERLSELKTATHIPNADVVDFNVTDKTASAILKDEKVFSGKLIVGCDGRGSFTREWMGVGARGWNYKQCAAVFTVTHENPHENVAVEDFRPEGPLAILPMNDDGVGHHRSAVVWSQHGRGAKFSDPKVFEMAVQVRFPEMYGAVKITASPAYYPLGLIHAYRYTAPRMALAADAAHGIHPIAGQGLNLGLRDIETLADLVASAREQKKDIGSADVLSAYETARRADNMSMAGATDMLNRLFSNPSKTLAALRRAGLMAVQASGPARRFFMRRAMGLK